MYNRPSRPRIDGEGPLRLVEWLFTRRVAKNAFRKAKPRPSSWSPHIYFPEVNLSHLGDGLYTCCLFERLKTALVAFLFTSQTLNSVKKCPIVQSAQRGSQEDPRRISQISKHQASGLGRSDMACETPLDVSRAVLTAKSHLPSLVWRPVYTYGVLKKHQMQVSKTCALSQKTCFPPLLGPRLTARD